MILFGHPTGSPFSHQAALAHYESLRLEAFCVPWMPTATQVGYLQRIPGVSLPASRLERRSFPPLMSAPRVEGPIREGVRMVRRLLSGQRVEERLAYEANDWLMRTMRKECRRPSVTAVHAYEDCSLWQFEEAKRRDLACIYDMPIGYYPAWEEINANLVRAYSDWLPPGELASSHYVRPVQKRKEMALADLVLAPTDFVRRSVHRFVDKEVKLAPYGVDLDFWQPAASKPTTGQLRFIYAGQCSLRKGIPVLLQAWLAAGLKDAELELVGPWRLAGGRQHLLPPGVRLIGPLSRAALRSRYRSAGVFVFPSFFEGFGLVLLEAMACGLPAVATNATAGPDVLSEESGHVIPAGDVEALVESLRWFSRNRDRLPEMARAARAAAELHSWKSYRRCVSEAVSAFA
ncbi:MAG: glycosyltransferase family 4 protein [Vicinamibacterales bacterium]